MPTHKPYSPRGESEPYPCWAAVPGCDAVAHCFSRYLAAPHPQFHQFCTRHSLTIGKVEGVSYNYRVLSRTSDLARKPSPLQLSILPYSSTQIRYAAFHNVVSQMKAREHRHVGEYGFLPKLLPLSDLLVQPALNSERISE